MNKIRAGRTKFMIFCSYGPSSLNAHRYDFGLRGLAGEVTDLLTVL